MPARHLNGSFQLDDQPPRHDLALFFERRDGASEFVEVRDFKQALK